MIQNCNDRPIGMSVREWCQANSITTANYYYRMTQVRKACLDSLPAEVVEHAIVPVPVKLVSPKKEQTTDNSFIELSAHGVTLRVTENTSDIILAKVLGVLAFDEIPVFGIKQI